MGNEQLPAMSGLMDRDLGGFGQTFTPAENAAAAAGMLMMQQTSREITARRVDVKRNVPAIMQEIRQMCAAFGDTYVYSWEVNNNAKGTRDTIKGPTIKLAMMLHQIFGNCSVDMDVTESATHWTFKAWFMDYEKGTSLSRLFQQRKKTGSGGKMDADRAIDLVFQVGQSKAARNVIVNALSSFTSFAMEESERGLLKRFESDEAKADAWRFMERVMSENDIDIKRVEAVIGRPEANWSIPNLAKAYMMLRGVHEGMTSAEDVFPTTEAAEEMIGEQDEERKETKSRASRKKAEPKKEEAPKVDEQPDTKAPAPEAAKAPAGDAAPQFKETQIEKIKAAYFDAEDFETIQAIRADVAKNSYQEAPGIAKAYEDAMARVKKANAAKAARAEAPKDGQDEGQPPSKADEQEERDLLADRIVAMFDGLDDAASIGEALRQAAHYADQLDEAGDARFKAALAEAQERAELAKKATESAKLAAEEAAKREATKPAPLASKAPPTMFSDDD